MVAMQKASLSFESVVQVRNSTVGVSRSDEYVGIKERASIDKDDILGDKRSAIESLRSERVADKARTNRQQQAVKKYADRKRSSV